MKLNGTIVLTVMALFSANGVSFGQYTALPPIFAGAGPYVVPARAYGREAVGAMADGWSWTSRVSPRYPVYIIGPDRQAIGMFTVRDNRTSQALKSNLEKWCAENSLQIATVEQASEEFRVYLKTKPGSSAGSTAESIVSGFPKQQSVEKAVSAGQSVELLNMIELKRDSIAGDWTMDEGTLLIPDSRAARLQLPFIPPRCYSLTVRVARRAKSGPLVLGLVFNGHQFCLLVHQPASGISTIDGRFAPDNNETTTYATRLEADKPATVRCVVTDSHVVAELDGKQFLNWKGDARRLSIDKGYAVPRKDTLFIAGNGGGFAISEIKIGPPGVGASAAPAGPTVGTPLP